jgi:hypothetical protein
MPAVGGVSGGRSMTRTLEDEELEDEKLEDEDRACGAFDEADETAEDEGCVGTGTGEDEEELFAFGLEEEDDAADEERVPTVISPPVVTEAGFGSGEEENADETGSLGGISEDAALES